MNRVLEVRIRSFKSVTKLLPDAFFVVQICHY
jgi:hypothetical protein